MICWRWGSRRTSPGESWTANRCRTTVADGERRRQVEDTLIDQDATQMTTRRLTYAIGRIVKEIDPDAARREHEHEKCRTHVRVWQDYAGMGILEARLTDEAAAVIDTVLDLLANAARNNAHRTGTPLDEIGKTHGQRRANALSKVFAAILNGTALQTTDTDDGTILPAWWQPPALPTRKRRRPHLVLRVDLPTLTGTHDWAGELEGYELPLVSWRLPHAASGVRSAGSDGTLACACS